MSFIRFEIILNYILWKVRQSVYTSDRIICLNKKCILLFAAGTRLKMPKIYVQMRNTFAHIFYRGNDYKETH